MMTLIYLMKNRRNNMLQEQLDIKTLHDFIVRKNLIKPLRRLVSSGIYYRVMREKELTPVIIQEIDKFFNITATLKEEAAATKTVGNARLHSLSSRIKSTNIVPVDESIQAEYDASEVIYPDFMAMIKKAGLHPSEVCAKIGVTYENLRLKSNMTHIKFQTLMKLAACLNVPVTTLYKLNGKRIVKPKVFHYTANSKIGTMPRQTFIDAAGYSTIPTLNAPPAFQESECGKLFLKYESLKNPTAISIDDFLLECSILILKYANQRNPDVASTIFPTINGNLWRYPTLSHSIPMLKKNTCDWEHIVCLPITLQPIYLDRINTLKNTNLTMSNKPAWLITGGERYNVSEIGSLYNFYAKQESVSLQDVITYIKSLFELDKHYDTIMNQKERAAYIPHILPSINHVIWLHRFIFDLQKNRVRIVAIKFIPLNMRVLYYDNVATISNAM